MSFVSVFMSSDRSLISVYNTCPLFQCFCLQIAHWLLFMIHVLCFSVYAAGQLEWPWHTSGTWPSAAGPDPYGSIGGRLHLLLSGGCAYVHSDELGGPSHTDQRWPAGGGHQVVSYVSPTNRINIYACICIINI